MYVEINYNYTTQEIIHVGNVIKMEIVKNSSKY